MRRTGFIQCLILFFYIIHLCLLTFIIPLEFKDIFFFSSLDRAPAVSYPGCEEKNCSAAPSLPPAQMHLGKGWTARHHLKQETEEARFLVNKRVDTCVPVCLFVCNCVCLYPLCQSSGWQPRGAQAGKSRSAARRWKERTELCRSPWNPSDQTRENKIVSEMLKENNQTSLT